MNLVTLSANTALLRVPALIEQGGDRAKRRYFEFFTAQIRNKGTRETYLVAVRAFFDWCDTNYVQFEQVQPIVVATYIEQLCERLSPPTVKVHLAAIKMLYDYLVTGQIVEFNPAAPVKGPAYSIKRGKTPVLDAETARQLIDAIDVSTAIGLRDRALIGVMVYSFARVSAVLAMNVDDFYPQGRRMWFRLHEKGGKLHEVPAHHNAEAYLDAYIEAANIGDQKKTPLFRTLDRQLNISEKGMRRSDALRRMKVWAAKAGVLENVCNHTWRATGITAYRANGGSLEHAMKIACHESATTTKLYDRTDDAITLDEIERVRI